MVARIELGSSSPSVGTLNRLLEAAGTGLDVSLRPTGSALSDTRRPPMGISDIKGRIQPLFAEPLIPGVVSVYLFGSHAMGNPHRESDVDIGVLLDWSTYPSRRDRSELRVVLGSELVAALHSNDVDVSILNDVPPGLARRIVVDGQRLVCNDPELDHAFVRDTQLRWADLAPFLRRMAAIKLEAIER